MAGSPAQASIITFMSAVLQMRSLHFLLTMTPAQQRCQGSYLERVKGHVALIKGLKGGLARGRWLLRKVVEGALPLRGLAPAVSQLERLGHRDHLHLRRGQSAPSASGMDYLQTIR